MNKKIRVLFYCSDESGVNYFRSLTPSIELEKLYPNDFYVEIIKTLDIKNPETLEYVKSFDIFHYHREFMNNLKEFKQFASEIKKSGTKLVMDIDDYWDLNKNHPYYSQSIEENHKVKITELLKISDYVTTTTELFATEIRDITNKDNVIVLFNSVNPEWMGQFQDKHKPDPDGRVRITYTGGSSHYGDLLQLEKVFNVLHNDSDLKNKFKIILAGWDADGYVGVVNFNPDFEKDLKNRNLWNNLIINDINSSGGDVDKMKKMPADLRNKYRNNVFKTTQRKINSNESVYFKYEKILTDNHSIIENKNYLKWLMNFDRNDSFPDEGNFARRWTKKVNNYMTVLDETDIVIAPLADNDFNRKKSPLKQVECWSRKLPIICSDVPPYNVDGKHMENCILIRSDKHAHKDWKKYLKKLILDADLRKKLGEQLYEDFKEKYHLSTITNKRAEFYKKITNNI